VLIPVTTIYDGFANWNMPNFHVLPHGICRGVERSKEIENADRYWVKFRGFSNCAGQFRVQHKLNVYEYVHHIQQSHKSERICLDAKYACQ
jgi:hypothetical protein